MVKILPVHGVRVLGPTGDSDTEFAAWYQCRKSLALSYLCRVASRAMMGDMPIGLGTLGSTRACKRRSPRIKLKIPIFIHAGDLVLKAETVSVSKHGAKIRVINMSEKLSCGDQLQVAVRTGKHREPARVVWLGKTWEPHCAIELEQESNFWGVYFPGTTDDGGRPARQLAPASKLPPDLPKATAAPPEPALPAAQLCIVPRSAPTVQNDAIETRTMPATLTGFSAVRMPLSESVDVEFTRPDEATALLRDLVEPGTAVRLLISKDRVVMGRVAAIGTQRQAGKWRVRIKCDAPCF